MSYTVDFKDVSTSAGVVPVADALAGLRANEARYFKNKYSHVFTVEPASEANAVDRLGARHPQDERDLVIESTPLEATAFEVEGIRMAYVFYESGLSINVMYAIEDGGKRAVGFKLSDGMDVPRSSRPASSSPGRSRSSPARSAAPTSSSRGPTNIRRVTDTAERVEEYLASQPETKQNGPPRLARAHARGIP